MIKIERTVNRLKRFLRSAQTPANYRTTERAFTRRRKLPFEFLVVMILRGRPYAAQTALNRFYTQMDMLDNLISAGGYHQARTKLKPEIFIALLQLLNEGFYQSDPDDPGTLWRGRRLLGFDPTVINVPDTPETRAAYSIQVNQHGQQVQAYSGVLYDLLNEITIAASLGKRCSGKQMLLEHQDAIAVNDVVVCDREFGDYGLLAWLTEHQRDYIVRLQSNSFLSAKAFAQAEEQEAMVDVEVTRKQRAFVKEHQLPEQIRVRLVKVPLCTGESEVLATSLLDQTQYSAQDLAEAYRLRWEIESYFARIKNIFAVERFSGGSVQFIEQDFYGTMFLSSLESMLIAPTQTHLQQQQDPRRHPKKVNRMVSYSALVDQAIAILLLPEDTSAQTIEKLERLFQSKPTSVRPNRNNKRTHRSLSHKNRALKYKKRPPA